MKTILYLIAILSIISCTKEVTLELADQEGTKIVVDAMISDNGMRQYIRISYNSSYYEDNLGAPISGASIEVFGDNKTYNFIESTQPDSSGYYFNDDISLELTPGDYALTVVTGGETYNATSTFSQKTVLDSLTFSLSPFTDFANFDLQPGEDSTYIYDINVNFTNPSEQSYFFFDRYKNRSLQTKRPSSKEIDENSSLAPYVSYSVYSFNTNNTEPGDTLGVTINTISEEYYEFLVVFFNQTDLSGNPFAGAPPANIPSNISNEGLGFFEVYSTSYAEKVYQP